MTARRGRPQVMVSDNGTNFRSADRELRELVNELDQERITNHLAEKGIQWRFNPPLGAHHRGVFEIMIKAAKKGLKAILGEAVVNDEEFSTAVAEVEGLLNARPITYCGQDPKDENVLTPNHFLIGQAGEQLAPEVTDKIAFHPRNRWRYVQDLVKKVWIRWQKEFLSLLHNRPKWFRIEEDIKPGDIVLMADPANPRGRWPLGRILEVFPGSDGRVRVVQVFSRGKEWRRPVSKLVQILSADEDARRPISDDRNQKMTSMADNDDDEDEK
ncbi:uncharacterized protein LOC135496150 [Lineus longissimus]|uniref:uncharacterized protein LOC135496150 n=1 Tax=Lineus longissimus TaxID=88925 RepID=UPI00315D09E2